MQLGCINSCFLSPEDCDNQLEQFSQGHFHLAFEYLQKLRLQTLMGNLFHCLVTFAVIFFFFLMFNWHFLYFSLCTQPLFLMLGSTEQSLALSSLPSPQQVFIRIHKVPPRAFSAPGQTVPSYLASPHMSTASAFSSSSWPFTGLAPICLHLILASPEPDTAFQVCCHQMWSHQC